MKRSACLLLTVLFLFTAVSAYSQHDLDVEELLREAVFFTADVAVIAPDGVQELWNTRVEKITIPGRPVDVILEGPDSKLKVQFSLYPTDSERLLLVARSEIQLEDDYSSAVTSIPVSWHEEVHYYPLGRAEETVGDNEVCMILKSVPYLETLEDREGLESALESSSLFNLR